MNDSTTLIAIDPDTCGCTECLIGEYKQLYRATDDDILNLAKGNLKDNTSAPVTVDYNSYRGVTITIADYIYQFPEENVTTLPPRNLAFDDPSITLDAASTEAYFNN